MALESSSERAKRARDIGWRRLGVVAVAGLGLSFAALFMLRDTEGLRAEDALDYAASEIASEIANRVAGYEGVVSQVRALYAASDDVTRAEFHAFTGMALRPHGSTLWLAWVPAVAPADAEALVARARQDGLGEFALRDIPLRATAAGARRGMSRHPITYIEPAGHLSALGVDLSSAPEWAAVLERVAQRGRETHVFGLAPLFHDRGAETSLTVVAPVRAHDHSGGAVADAARLEGFLVAQIDASRALPETVMADLGVALRDPAGRVVASHWPGSARWEGEGAGPSDRTLTRPVLFGPDTWQVAVTPGPAFVAARRTSLPWIAFAGGLAATLLAALYMRVLMRATASATRTAADLLASRRALDRETGERRVLEERIRHAQKMEAMGTLAGGIAHDFNNILSAILGYTELATAEVEPGTPVHECLVEVTRAGRRAADLVAQILALSRQTVHERRPLRLHTVVLEAIKLLRGSIPSTLEIREDVDRTCPPVKADPTEIHQIVMNLCTNAYHAMREEGGVLVITLSPALIREGEASQDPRMRPGTYVRLTVSDTGHGMAPETLQRIFEPYFTTREPGQGTGLGLATVHGIVDGMGGVIHVYSELGHGSTFNVFFEALAPEADAAEAVWVDPRALCGAERVLMVDDEEAITAFAEVALGRMGYRVTTCNRSLDALALCERDPTQFDVVITDQMMPKLRGSELSRRLRALRPDLPIILCSGFGDVMAQEHQDAGLFAGSVTKPVIASDLAAAIRRVFPTAPEAADETRLPAEA